MRHPRPTPASGYGKGCTGINFAAGAASAACRYDYPFIHIHNNSDNGNTTERGACGARIPGCSSGIEQAEQGVRLRDGAESPDGGFHVGDTRGERLSGAYVPLSDQYVTGSVFRAVPPSVRQSLPYRVRLFPRSRGYGGPCSFGARKGPYRRERYPCGPETFGRLPAQRRGAQRSPGRNVQLRRTGTNGFPDRTGPYTRAAARCARDGQSDERLHHLDAAADIQRDKRRAQAARRSLFLCGPRGGAHDCKGPSRTEKPAVRHDRL